MNTVTHLPQHTFLHYNRDTQVFDEASVPFASMPNYRIYLDPTDKDAPDDMVVLYGNAEDYDLGLLEHKQAALVNIEQDNTPLFRDKSPDISDIVSDVNTDTIHDTHYVDVYEDLVSDLKEPPPKKQKTSRRRKKDVEIDIEPAPVPESEDIIQPDGGTSEQDV